MYALVDCNNFYASCERVFRPDLAGIPIVVLSNNDGCVIARSDEAKLLGIEMGAAYFEIERELRRLGIRVFSSNYALYGDLSQRVTASLREFAPEIEVYSIDEAFLNLRGFTDLPARALAIKAGVQQWTGIPVSVGIAPTKTLAKIANRVGKRWPGQNGTFVLPGPDPDILAHIKAGDIWGIGRRLTRHLDGMGVKTALDLARMDARLARMKFSVVVERVVRELQGIPCIPFDEAPPHPQHIIVSRGFKGRVRAKAHLSEALVLYASRAGEKARQKGVYAAALTAFIHTSPFTTGPKYENSRTIVFNEPRNDTGTLAKAAIAALDGIYRPGFEYQKAGIMLTGLVYAHERQPSLFGGTQSAQTEHLMKVIDGLNRRFGRETVRVAASGTSRPWWMARERLSPCYTTRWADLPRLLL